MIGIILLDVFSLCY